jgi:hypothetical protein
MIERHRAHELIERIPDSQLATAVRFLEFMLLDSEAREAAIFPAGDDSVSRQDYFGCQIGQTWLRHQGTSGVRMDDVLAKFGQIRSS